MTAEPVRSKRGREPTAGQPDRSARDPFRYGDDWWRRGVVYQIYPRSFADSDGDGVGDLPGIIDHLDHLGPDGLGVDAIWLSPIYPSPGLDVGYDVSDHSAIDPRFGTEADFDRLVDEAHRRGIRVDPRPGDEPHERRAPLVHRLAAIDATGSKADWYLWRDAAGLDPARPAAAAEQLGLVVRWPGLDVGAAPRPVLPPHLPRRAAGARLARARRSRPPSSTWSGAGWRAASTASGSTPSTSSSSIPRCRSNPPRRGTSAWTRQVHRLRHRPAGPAGPDRPVPGHRRRATRPDERRRAVRRAPPKGRQR